MGSLSHVKPHDVDQFLGRQGARPRADAGCRDVFAHVSLDDLREQSVQRAAASGSADELTFRSDGVVPAPAAERIPGSREPTGCVGGAALRRRAPRFLR